MNKSILHPVVFILFITAFAFMVSCTTTDSAGFNNGPTETKTLTLSGYVFTLPDWWDSVRVSVPDSLTDEQKVREFVYARYGMDTGTDTTWREALKTWALAAERLNLYPVYIAHCYRAGKQYLKAAQIYGDLYELAGTQGANRDWYRVYLSYNAGEAYAKAGDPQQAKIWYKKAVPYRGNKDSAIDYYASTAAKRLAEID
ncbi:MAG TPA: tetratricopeptide repeat protein [Spirochaetia bacterium]|nr:tetratricopeptide repeat protein [Spirochaetia bacterium]